MKIYSIALCAFALSSLAYADDGMKFACSRNPSKCAVGSSVWTASDPGDLSGPTACQMAHTGSYYEDCKVHRPEVIPLHTKLTVLKNGPGMDWVISYKETPYWISMMDLDYRNNK